MIVRFTGDHERNLETFTSCVPISAGEPSAH